MTHRCLYFPRVVTPTATPDMVVTRIPTGSPDTYFEQTMTPQEAENYALDMLLDARRARAYRERAEFMARLGK